MNPEPESQDDSSTFNWKLWLIVFAIIIGGIGVAGAIVFKQVYAGEIPANVRKHFRNLEEIEFCTINPIPLEQLVASPNLPQPNENRVGLMDGFEITDMTKINNDGQLLKAIYKSDGENNSMVAGCFNPRHAIRDPGNSENYLLICFECMQLRYSLNGEKNTILISVSAKRMFDAMVDQQGLTRSQEFAP